MTAGPCHAPATGSISAILLAAGGSTRLGRPKQLIEFRGRSLIRRAAVAAIDAGLRPVVVVLGHEPDACRAQLDGLDVAPIVNADWARGIGSSLRAGIRHLRQTARATAALVTLCDQPHVDAGALRRLVAAHVETGAPIVAARYDGTLGVPAIFAASLFDRLCALPDDAGAKRIIREDEPRVVAVDLPEARSDIDTEADLRRLQGDNLTQRCSSAEKCD